MVVAATATELVTEDAARRLIAERFSVERMVTATEDLYSELLARKQARRSMAA